MSKGKSFRSAGDGVARKKQQSQVIFDRCRGETGRLYQEKPLRSELGCLFLWSEWPVISQGVPVGVGDSNKMMNNWEGKNEYIGTRESKGEDTTDGLL